MTELDDRSRELRDNLAAVRARIADAARAAGRAADDVTLIVVSKYFPVADVRRLIDLGVTDFGMTMFPSCRCQRRMTWAGVRPSSAAIAPIVGSPRTLP